MLNNRKQAGCQREANSRILNLGLQVSYLSKRFAFCLAFLPDMTLKHESKSSSS